jgi:hypothetical protein
VIVLGVSSHLTYLTHLYFNVYFNFAALAIATAVMSIISLLVMYASLLLPISAMVNVVGLISIVIDLMRKGTVTVVSMIVVELGGIGLAQ